MVASPLGILDNSNPKDIRDHFKAAGFSELLADGDLTAISDLVYNNQTEVKSFGMILHLLTPPTSHCSQETMKERLFGYYAAMGMMDALQLVRDSGCKPSISNVCFAYVCFCFVNFILC